MNLQSLVEMGNRIQQNSIIPNRFRREVRQRTLERDQLFQSSFLSSELHGSVRAFVFFSRLSSVLDQASRLNPCEGEQGRKSQQK